ncbi:hypothetical protein V1Y59_04445 [Gordonia sp. PKS22-38]|uniref:Uncharacterized protein n=1 Tax=Gordonia prachuapensis TaxID=3115651 RepID=A0ABU7MPQ3_9ACTN|nr:hypothetical protein [Gordonia sp. PKS22-38]
MGRNRKPAPRWAPHDVARIRAELAHGYQQFIAIGDREIELNEITLEQLSALVDDGILQDLRPDFHDELLEEQEFYLENLPRLRNDRVYAQTAAASVATFAPIWIPLSAVEAARSVEYQRSDTTSLIALGYSGCLLFDEPIGRIRACIDLFRLDVTDVDVDGVLWWGYVDDEPDEQDSGASDRGRLRADAVILHVLTRTRPSERLDFLSPWRASTLADAARVVVPLTLDLKVTQADDIEPIVTVLQQLGTAVEESRLRLNQLSIPKSKYEYVKPGWPKLPRMTSVSVLAA